MKYILCIKKVIADKQIILKWLLSSCAIFLFSSKWFLLQRKTYRYPEF